MDHPGIAKVHDAGATDTGRPYFVMEFGIQEMNMLTALLNMFNGAGVSLPFPAALVNCGIGVANANYILAHDVDPTTKSNCTCLQ